MTNVENAMNVIVYNTTLFTVYNLWRSIRIWWNNLASIWGYPSIRLNHFDTEEFILFGYFGVDEGSNVLNYLLLYVKYYIYISNQTESEVHLHQFLTKLKWWFMEEKDMYRIKNFV